MFRWEEFKAHLDEKEPQMLRAFTAMEVNAQGALQVNDIKGRWCCASAGPCVASGTSLDAWIVNLLLMSALFWVYDEVAVTGEFVWLVTAVLELHYAVSSNMKSKMKMD